MRIDGEPVTVRVRVTDDLMIGADIRVSDGNAGNASWRNGTDGANIILESTSGRIILAGYALTAGDGGAGLGSRETNAIGGNGGRGGGIWLLAEEVVGPAIINVGNGGPGGDALSSGPKDVWNRGGDGGDSGRVFPAHLASISTGGVGGKGGNAGLQDPQYGDPEWAARSDSNPYADDRVCVDDPEAFPSANTSALVANPLVPVGDDSGRQGGNASAVARAGIASCRPGFDAGNGGNATSIAGSGGNGMRRGGNGGLAYARAGAGANVTVPHCAGTAGNGGWGGNATAQAGDGGAATNGPGGDGGAAIAWAGSAGDGGTGARPGTGGTGGWANATAGDGGLGLTGGGSGGDATSLNGGGGAGGAGCALPLASRTSTIGYEGAAITTLLLLGLAAWARRRVR